MFVRFRSYTSAAMQVSIVETRRAGGKVRHEHVAGLGSIEMPPTVSGRVAFWRALHERLGRLGNRLDPETQARLLGSVHERIPMVTPDEQRTLQRENFEADEKFWTDLDAGTAEDKKGLAAKVGHEIAEGQAELAKTAARHDTAKVKRERLDRGAEGSSG
jgi:hypothetical protein